MQYAKALLQKAQAESDPLGGRLKTGETVCAAADDEEEEEEEGEAEGEGDEDGAQEADDLELAFQCFEVARVIYQKETDDHQLELAEVLEHLGEVSMENERWEEAIGELRQSLEIKQSAMASDHRELAHLHYQLATASVAWLENARTEPPSDGAGACAHASPDQSALIVAHCRTQAVAHYGLAADVLERRLLSLDESSGEAEAADLAELLAEVRAKVDEVAQLGFPAEAAAAPAKPVGVTMDGLGPPSTTTIGFGSGGSLVSGAGSSFTASTTSLPVKNLGVVGGASGRRKAVLEPITNDGIDGEAQPAVQPNVKRVRLESTPIE